MKNIIRTTTAVAALALLAACGNTKSNNASYEADTTNKNNIAERDSAKEDLTKADKEKKKLDIKESEFLVKSFEAGMYEIELAQSAEKHSASPTIKELAAQLIADHKAFNSQMQTVAFNADLKLPGGIDSEHAKDLTDLEKTEAKDYDKKFMDLVVKGHEKSVEGYTNATKELANNETKSYAAATLPKIQGHLAMAKKIQDGMKK